MKKHPVGVSIVKHEKPPVEGSIAVGARPKGGYENASCDNKKKPTTNGRLKKCVCIAISHFTFHNSQFHISHFTISHFTFRVPAIGILRSHLVSSTSIFSDGLYEEPGKIGGMKKKLYICRIKQNKRCLIKILNNISISSIN